MSDIQEETLGDFWAVIEAYRMSEIYAQILI